MYLYRLDKKVSKLYDKAESEKENLK